MYRLVGENAVKEVVDVGVEMKSGVVQKVEVIVDSDAHATLGKRARGLRRRYHVYPLFSPWEQNQIANV